MRLAWYAADLLEKATALLASSATSAVYCLIASSLRPALNAALPADFTSACTVAATAARSAFACNASGALCSVATAPSSWLSASCALMRNV
eukprot:371365-Prymnesium_polylepis.2